MRAVKSPITLLATLAAGLASLSAAAQEVEAQPTVEQPAPETATPAASESSADIPAPATSPPATPVQTPSRGSTMDAVKAKFGTPTQEVAAVGEPPISRWEYPGYIVYFEYDKVLHTVVAR